MIGCGILAGVLSVIFFVVWQYYESPWLIFGYVLSLFAVCSGFFFLERRKTRKMLDRFEQILEGKSTRYIADENLTPTERRLIMRLCELEAREAKVQEGYRL